MLRYATALVGPVSAADIVQEAFLELCRQEAAELEGRLAPWLFTVTKRRALDLLRRNGRAESLPDGEELASPDSGPQIKAERHQMLTQLQALVAELPEREREVVLLKFGGGLSYKEIAATLALSVSNVGFILHTMSRRSTRSYLAIGHEPRPGREALSEAWRTNRLSS